MLSSLLQQSSQDYTVLMSFIRGSSTVDIINLFKSSKMPFSSFLEQPDRDSILDRGHRRTDMLKASKQPWIMFTDSDVVYPPNFIERLNIMLACPKYRDCTNCMVPGRRSTELDTMEALVRVLDYPCIVPDAYEAVNKLNPVKIKNVGAGYCQIINRQAVLDRLGGNYVPENLKMDYINKKGQYRTKSDKYFRKQMGVFFLRPRALPLQIHLQHRRDNYENPDN